jgi:hypothetical protein
MPQCTPTQHNKKNKKENNYNTNILQVRFS